MRYIAIIGFLIFLSSCYAQTKVNDHKFGQFRYYQNDTIQARLKEIVRTDSIKNPDICSLIFKSFDKHDTLVAELKYYQCQNNTKNRYLTRNIYNKFGKIILYELFDMEGLEIERYKFDYNDKGQLIQKEGFLKQ